MDKDTSNMDTEIKTESESPKRFTSVLELRKIKRKEEDEANIEWSPLEKPDKSAIESRMDNIIENLKNQFKEEKFARRQAPKVSTSYKVFCNSVDAFLRHLENPKVKYQESDRELPGNAVKPDKITSTKQMSVDTPAQTSPVHDESLDDEEEDADDADDDVQHVKHKECENLISQMLNNVILRDLKTIHCSEAFSLTTPHFFGEPTVKKLVKQTKANDMKPMPSLFQKRHTSNAYFFSLKQKELTNGCLLPSLLASSSFIGLNMKQMYMEFHEFYEVKFKPAELSILISNSKYKVGNHNDKCEHLPVNKCHEIAQFKSIIADDQKLQTKRKNEPITLDIEKPKVTDFKRIFSLSLRYNRVPCTRTLSIFGLYFTPLLYFGREAEMPCVPHSPANFTDEHIPKGCYNISTLLTLAATTCSLKNKLLTTENVFYDNVAITSSHLNTKYPAVKDLDSHKLKSAKHDDTSGKDFFDNFETMEKNDSKQDEVKPDELEVIIDDDDDDSLFGILSVYCRSEIHSR